jgi:hypothetical protein
VSLDLEADAALTLGDEAPRMIAALREATERRLAEINRVIAAPLEKPLDFHGAWSTHYRQSFAYFMFDSNGDVFVLQTRDKGGTSYGVYDYHVTDDEVVIEMAYFPIRLKRGDEDKYWEQDGQRHYGLFLEDPRMLFPECDKPLFLMPSYKSDWPIRRPLEDVAGGAAAAGANGAN